MNVKSKGIMVQDFNQIPRKSPDHTKSENRHINFVHVVNFYKTNDVKQVETQKFSKQSLYTASNFPKILSKNSLRHSVKLVAAVYKADAIKNTKGFSSRFIVQSAKDQPNLDLKKNLPNLHEIIKTGEEFFQTNSINYLVYTNADIIIEPYFYEAISVKIKDGHDVIICNRRDVAKGGNDTILDALCSTGVPHPGYDCFVISEHVLSKIYPFVSFIGVPGVMKPLLHQCLLFSENPIIIKSGNITKHFGFDGSWKNENYEKIIKHNFLEAIKAIEYAKVIDKNAYNQWHDRLTQEPEIDVLASDYFGLFRKKRSTRTANKFLAVTKSLLANLKN